MKLFTQIVAIACLWLAIVGLARHIPLQPVAWESFFPKISDVQKDNPWLSADMQYLFVYPCDEHTIERLREDGMVEASYRLDTDGCLLLFPKKFQQAVVETFAGHQIAGTSAAGIMLLRGFSRSIGDYTQRILPILLIVSLFLFPLRYWIGVLFELSLFACFVLVVAWLLRTPLTIVSAMAALFLFIYTLTMLNYLHLSRLDRRKLLLGIGVSLVTTLISALYLWRSEFALIHDFGRTLSIGLILLALYLSIRLLTFRNGVPLFGFLATWYDTTRRWRMARYLIGLYIFAILVLLLYPDRVKTDLNPFNILPAQDQVRHRIVDFEKRLTPALPVTLSYTLHHDTFESLKNARKAIRLFDHLRHELGLTPLITLSNLYRRFAHQSPLQADDASWAQFLFALELEEETPLFDEEMKTLYQIYAISLLTPTWRMSRLQHEIVAIDHELPEASLALRGKLAHFDTIETIFVQEGVVGFLFSYLFILLFFIFYCKSLRIVPIITAGALFPIVLFLLIHSLLQIPLTLLSIIALILYAGLYADSFIHIFICYAHRQEACLADVLRPVAVSNATMIAALAGMIFTGSLLGRFGIEMTTIFAINLIGVFVLLPGMLTRYLKSCNV